MFIICLFQLVISISSVKILVVLHYFPTAKIRKLFGLVDFIGWQITKDIYLSLFKKLLFPPRATPFFQPEEC